MVTPKHKLVIVEGLTGLGKSTMAHYLARQYRYNGIPAVWIHEGEDPHPVSIDADPDIHAYMDKASEQWESFVARIQEADQVTVIEAGFFNNLLERLYAHCLDEETTIRYGLKLQAILDPVHPALFYLVNSNVPAALERNFSNRGERFKSFVIDYIARTPLAKQRGYQDDTGVTAFWQGFVSLMDRIFTSYEIDKLALDVSTLGYDRCYQQALELLCLREFSDPVISPQQAREYVGSYRVKGSAENFIVIYEDGVLVTDIFMHVNKKLILKDEHTFLVESWRFELTFDHDPSTGVTTIVVGGKDIDYLHAVGMKAVRVQA
jgi:hypothetical protein